jgi:hypothetical protein
VTLLHMIRGYWISHSQAIFAACTTRYRRPRWGWATVLRDTGRAYGRTGAVALSPPARPGQRRRVHRRYGRHARVDAAGGLTTHGPARLAPRSGIVMGRSFIRHGANWRTAGQPLEQPPGVRSGVWDGLFRTSHRARRTRWTVPGDDGRPERPHQRGGSGRLRFPRVRDRTIGGLTRLSVHILTD